MAKQVPELVQSERKRLMFFGLPFTFTKYTITKKKLILNEGLFTSVENEILLYRVLDITLKRTLGQKICGLGTVIVQSQDKTHSVLYIKNIKNPVQFKENLSNYVEEEKARLNMRRGEYINGDNDCHDPSHHHGPDSDFPDMNHDGIPDF